MIFDKRTVSHSSDVLHTKTPARRSEWPPKYFVPEWRILDAYGQLVRVWCMGMLVVYIHIGAPFERVLEGRWAKCRVHQNLSADFVNLDLLRRSEHDEGRSY